MSIYINSRTTYHGKMLNNYALNKIKFPIEPIICRDYMIKETGVERSNAYCIDLNKFLKINHLSRLVFLKYGNRTNVFYSGDYSNNEIFYLKQYVKFKETLLLYSGSYDTFIKLDIENFYENINIKKYYDKLYNFEEATNFLAYIEEVFGEYPILQDNIGVSYFATTIVLQDLDKNIEMLLKKEIDDFKMVRYSDDLYIFLNTVPNNIKNMLEFLFIREGFRLNLNKYLVKDCTKISDNLSTMGYNFYVNDGEFKIEILIDHEVEEGVRKFFEGIKIVDNIDSYLNLKKKSFTLERETVSKSFFNELIHSNRYDKIVVPYVNNCILDLIKILNFDPQGIVKLILKSSNENISCLLRRIYLNLETKENVQVTMIAISTYITNRNVTDYTRQKLLSKIKSNDNNLYNYICNYILPIT